MAETQRFDNILLARAGKRALLSTAGRSTNWHGPFGGYFSDILKGQTHFPFELVIPLLGVYCEETPPQTGNKCMHTVFTIPSLTTANVRNNL